MRFPLLCIALAACSGPPIATADRERLEADWTGSDTGRIAGRAVAEWCDSLRVLEVRAVQGDSGLALALYPRDSIRADSYPVLPPGRADSTPPGAAVALRWFAETSLKGFRSDSGAVVVEAVAAQRVTGRFQAYVRSLDNAERLTLRGRFRAVPVVRAARGCVSRTTSEPADSV